jgi:F0F1-type ATP synthase assembly protein I
MSRRGDYGAGMALASTISQVGCVTVIIIIGALLLGLFLDNLLDTRPILTILLILVSIPISLFSVVRIALSAARRVQAPAGEEASEEGEDQQTHG